MNFSPAVVETRANVIPEKNDTPEELKKVAEWIRDNLGVDSPWHVTKFCPAYQLPHVPPTPNEIIDQAAATGREIGLKHVHGHSDISCDYATENAPVSAWLELDAEALNEAKICAADCCGDEGILVKKYEVDAGFFNQKV
ncbi:MAG: pyruvate formate lyase activating enzyme [Gammaproteobacteria bacterium]|jgi:pyruvate formate lyase activating enzyme